MNIEKEVLEMVRHYVVENGEEIDLEADPEKNLHLDSLQIVSLLVDLEQTYEVEFDLDDINIDSMNKVAGIVSLVRKYKEAA